MTGERIWRSLGELVAERIFWIYFTVTVVIFLFGLGGVIGEEKGKSPVLLFWAFLLLAALVVAQPFWEIESQNREQAGDQRGKKAILYTLQVVLSLLWLNMYVYGGGGRLILALILLVTLWGMSFVGAKSPAFSVLGIQFLAVLGALFLLWRS